ncbi:DUF423 domain-containing protein [Tenacibaculum sp. MEBiC06402]|uniref:DUF423 domain-containing protein n=1 Tax=unclassified Tenacibaculum TaxID=2635139 RepID=UPI003B9B5527
MYKNLTIIAFLGAITILLGAFGAHSLKESLSEEAIKSFETAVRYQMYHVILLMILNLSNHLTDKFKRVITITILIGVLFFSGSIYCIYLLKIPAKQIWFVTPLGGLILFFGWGQLCYHFLKKSLKK